MKLLLTSSGLGNKSIINALRELTEKDFTEAKLVFIPTAANVDTGDKCWLIKNLNDCAKLSFKEIDIVDVASMPKELWLPRLEKADVIMMGGGSTSYLMRQMKKSGLLEILPELLKSRIYVGISAGSMVAAPSLKEKEMQRLYEEPILEIESDDGLNLVDFLVVPHLGSPYLPRVAELIDEVAKDIDIPLYAIDDETAVKVVDGKAEVISEGQWKRFN